MLKDTLILILMTVILIVGACLFVVQPVFVEIEQKETISSPSSLKSHVLMLSETLPKRSDDVDSLNHSADYIHEELSKFSSRVRFQEYGVWGITYKNVIAEFGDEGSNSCGSYVVGAHYDAFRGLPGADDNASGVAGLLELAKIFSKSPPPCHLYLVAYALEEPPYFRTDDMGSYAHAKSLKEAQKNIKLMINLEMIGYFSDTVGSQDYPFPLMKHLYSDKGDFIAIVANTTQVSATRFFKKEFRKANLIQTHSINAPALLAGIDFSDHLNYWYFDFPAIMVTDTAFYRNKNYHTKDDTAEKLDYHRMGKVVDSVYYSLTAYMKQNNQ